MDLAARVTQLEAQLQSLATQRINQSQIIPGSLSQGSIAAGFALLQMGKAANKPTKGTNICLFYFATDTNHLYAWNNNAWKSVTLT